jgi:hypothetical protein
MAQRAATRPARRVSGARRRSGGRWKRVGPALRRLGRRLRRLWPSARRRRRWLRAFRRSPGAVQLAIVAAALLATWAVTNVAYQVIRKPTELFFPVSDTLHKLPSETWDAYAHLFRRHATPTIPAELLAALAQIEASGNPVARTYWRWSWALHPFELYRPASSAVGMYQFTDGTFEQAKRYCIHDHRVVEEGPWYDWRTCWFNELYFRVVPSHAIELTSAYLDRAVSKTLARHGIRRATPAQKQRLAALIHLCGSAAGERYARRGLALSASMRCGDHSASGYVSRVERMSRVFASHAARDR